MLCSSNHFLYFDSSDFPHLVHCIRGQHVVIRHCGLGMVDSGISVTGNNCPHRSSHACKFLHHASADTHYLGKLVDVHFAISACP